MGDVAFRREYRASSAEADGQIYAETADSLDHPAAMSAIACFRAGESGEGTAEPYMVVVREDVAAVALRHAQSRYVINGEQSGAAMGDASNRDRRLIDAADPNLASHPTPHHGHPPRDAPSVASVWRRAPIPGADLRSG